jgi:putative ABC transport system substrate-binding protein
MNRVKRRDFIALLGGAVAMSQPNAGIAQQPKLPVIGLLATLSSDNAEWLVPAFKQGLEDTGYIEGQNVAIEYRWAEGRYDRLPALAAELIDRKVVVIAAGGGIPSVLAAKSATSTIPIVFYVGTDPVQEGLVASLGRPGGNLTGISILLVELNPKRVELLSELVPHAKLIALLVNPTNTTAESIISTVQEAATAKGKQLRVLKAGTEDEIETAFASLSQSGVDGIIVGNDPFFLDRREQLVMLVSRQAVPAIFAGRHFATAGGLISYGPSLSSAYRQIGVYTGKILKGAKPADLPVEQPTKFELVINLKTAKALGLTVPLVLLAQADEVIE